MKELRLPALRGTNPLGFFAALGVLDIATRSLPSIRPTLRWEGQLTPTAILGGVDNHEELTAIILDDLENWNSSVVLQGYAALPPDDIKPDPTEVRQWFEAAAESQNSADLPLLHALISEGSVAGKGDSKPTHFHFTAGQQKFLGMCRDLRDRLTEEHLTEALNGPWKNASDLPVMGWDNSRGERLHALSNKSPTKDKKLGTPGADWLGFLGLTFFPVATNEKHELLTTGCAPEWKVGGHFTWPLWDQPLSSIEISPLLAENIEGYTEQQRLARGVYSVLRAPIRRADQGGYGSFGPTASV